MANHASQRCRHPTRHVRKSNSKLKLPSLADRKISKALATSINKRYFQKMKRLKIHRLSEHDLRSHSSGTGSLSVDKLFKKGAEDILFLYTIMQPSKIS
jgi:hypothetical protein